VSRRGRGSSPRRVESLMRVLHACWSSGRLHFWGEGAPAGENGHDGAHPFALQPGALEELFQGAPESSRPGEPADLEILLPTLDGEPRPSATLAHELGEDAYDEGGAPPALHSWRVPTVTLTARGAARYLLAVGDVDGTEPPPAAQGASMRWFLVAAGFARRLIAAQRFVPEAEETADYRLMGLWRPWLLDEPACDETARLVRAMPPSARCVADSFEHHPWRIAEDFLDRTVDALCRTALVEEELVDAIEDRDPSDPHVAWLGGLLGEHRVLDAGAERSRTVSRGVRSWLGRLDASESESEWRLALALEEPLVEADEAPPDATASGTSLHGSGQGEETAAWTLRLGIAPAGEPERAVDASELWIGGVRPASGASGDVLLAELARASRICPRLEAALSEAEPTALTLTTGEAYEFLRDEAPLLREQGCTVEAPSWWGEEASRVGLTLEINPVDGSRGAGGAEGVGLDALVTFQWRLAVGDRVLTADEFQRLAEQRSGLIQVGGRWIELRPDDAEAALSLVRSEPAGETTAREALRLALSTGPDGRDLPLHIQAGGWLDTLLGGTDEAVRFEEVDQPEGFRGSLRRYQRRGVSWLAFLDRLGLGACLADDMGLGKTIELLALLLHEKERAAEETDGAVAAEDVGSALGPTLIVAPMSVIGNWRREAERFAPGLRVRLHHGVDRPSGERFAEAALDSDAVITTYALAHRDVDDLAQVRWRRVVLDEAQNIKNPNAKQTRSIQSLSASRRIALTGTPVENRLSELWSIMEFCNPGFLGSAGEFQRRFAAPIERRRDRRRAEALRTLTRPFILRRLKTDPQVTTDLPEKIETREFTALSPEQASLYERTVEQMLRDTEGAEGMRRRGLVLAALIKLKQICNHPAQALREAAGGEHGPPAAARSGKCVRLREMLDEALGAGDQALVFTQFRQMGHILARMLRHDLDREVLFLHGGVPQAQRDRMVERFQQGDGSAPIFILSLKAGGLGMNLTAASHVFHFDRWWNPAVEDQATDRAHRIGQTRTVHVHKFVVSGTLEERIDQMIEQKSDLAERIIGSGERWLTELSTDQLRDLVTLRRDAVMEGWS